MWFVFSHVVSPTSLLYWLQEFFKFCFSCQEFNVRFEWPGRHLNVKTAQTPRTRVTDGARGEGGTHISVGCRCLWEGGKRSAPTVWLAEIWPVVLKAPPPAGVWLAPPVGPETPCHGTRTTWREEEIRGQSVVEPQPLSWRCLRPEASSVWAPQLQE